MRNEPEIDNCELFALYADDDLERWKAIVGQQVSYEKYGRGTVTDVYRNDYGAIRLKIRFDKGEEKIWDPKEGYGKYFADCTLPAGLDGLATAREQLIEKKRKEEELDEERRKRREQEELERQRELEERRKQEEKERQQREREAKDRRHFADLKRKYQVEEFADESPISQLYKILIKIEEGATLNKRDKEFIKVEHLCQIFDICYKKYGDAWYKASASACWRDRDNPKRDPQRALKSTEGVKSDDPKCMAAIFTTRGAAYADLGELAEAERCAREAIEYSDSYHPYNLLGRIYCKMDLHEQGAEYFEEARKRNAPAKEQKDFIKSTFQELDEEGKKETRAEVARWLLEKDPKRYAWAKEYLE